MEFSFVPGTLHSTGSSIKQAEISNDKTMNTDNVAKKTVIVFVVTIIVVVKYEV